MCKDLLFLFRLVFCLWIKLSQYRSHRMYLDWFRSKLDCYLSMSYLCFVYPQGILNAILLVEDSNAPFLMEEESPCFHHPPVESSSSGLIIFTHTNDNVIHTSWGKTGQSTLILLSILYYWLFNVFCPLKAKAHWQYLYRYPSLALIFGMGQTKNSNFSFIREEAFSRHLKCWNCLIGWHVPFSP